MIPKKAIGYGVVGIVLVVGVYSFVSHYNKLKRGHDANLINEKAIIDLAAQKSRDSLLYTQISLKEEQAREYLEAANKTLLDQLEEDKIQLRRVRNVLTQILDYQDTTKTEIDLRPLLTKIDAQPKGLSIIEWKDENECFYVAGDIVYNGEEFTLNIKERRFKNKTDIVHYVRRQKWKLLFFNTRFLGKRKLEIKVYNTCGETETVEVDLRKK